MSTNNQNQEVNFITVSEFKTLVNETKLDVIRNKNTDKLFIAGEKSNYKCQLDIDMTKDMKFLIKDGDLTGACLVNVTTNTENIIGSL